MPQLDFSTYFSQFIWLFISFSLTYTFVSLFLLPIYRSILENRISLIKKNISDAEQYLNEENNMSEKITIKLNNANLEAKRILSEAIKKISDEKYIKLQTLSRKLLNSEHKIIQDIRDEYELVERDFIKQLSYISHSIAEEFLNNQFFFANKKIDHSFGIQKTL